jgi:hypothetical protein
MPIRMPKVEFDVVDLAGGLDQVTPTLKLKPGVCRDALNYECAPTGGYARIAGYERYDGLDKPSDATCTYLQVVAFTNTPVAGQTLTGGSSLATGTIVAVTATYMVLTQLVGTFTSGEAVSVGATPIGTLTDLTTTVTSQEQAQHLNLAADVYRALIGAVPGSGAVRGVFSFAVSGVDKVFAFRDNAGATGADLYVASASGWTQVPYKYEISFTAGNAAVPVAGETLTQGAVTATVRRVMDSSGSTTWAAANTAGRFVIDAPAGGSFVAGAATLSGGATCTLSGAESAITMLPGGHFELDKGNLAGSTGTIRIYGCDGVNRGFEFDGTTLAPVATGAATDTPKHVKVHKNHLMWGIEASIVHSGPGVPFRYLAVDGGGEIATGDTITGFLVQPGVESVAALAVYRRGSTSILYGTGLADWNFVDFSPETGALHYTAQNLSRSHVLDDRGVVSLSTSQAYGNFTQASLTSNIQTFIRGRRTKAIESTVSRERSQYRLFFSDGYGLYMTIVNGRLLGSMPVYFANTVSCAYSGELVDGSEVAYFGDTTGYVHQMDVGSSFDGEAIGAYVTLNYNPVRSPRIRKRYRHASVEMQGSSYAAISFGYRLGYATSEIEQPTAVNYAANFSSVSSWDTFTWDAFTWDGSTLVPNEIDVRGTAENIEITLGSATDYIYPFTLNSIVLHFTPRRGLR